MHLPTHPFQDPSCAALPGAPPSLPSSPSPLRRPACRPPSPPTVTLPETSQDAASPGPGSDIDDSTLTSDATLRACPLSSPVTQLYPSDKYAFLFLPRPSCPDPSSKPLPIPLSRSSTTHNLVCRPLPPIPSCPACNVTVPPEDPRFPLLKPFFALQQSMSSMTIRSCSAGQQTSSSSSQRAGLLSSLRRAFRRLPPPSAVDQSAQPPADRSPRLQPLPHRAMRPPLHPAIPRVSLAHPRSPQVTVAPGGTSGRLRRMAQW